MSAKKEKTTKTTKNRRVKVMNLDSQKPELSDKDLKQVKGGFQLQEIQQTLNRVNETVTNLSKSQSDAEKSITQNLSV